MVFGTFLVDTLVLIGTLIVLLYLWMKHSFKYWSNLGVPTLPVQFPYGTVKSIVFQKESVAEHTKKLYDHAKSLKQKHGGGYFLTKAIYSPIDPELIKRIMQSDFHHFVDRGVFYNEKDDPLSAHLFSIEGKKWKNLRAKLTPTFTSGRMKMMLETVTSCGDELIKYLDVHLNEPLDIKEVLARFTTDIIGSCAFGIKCNSLNDPDNEFRVRSKTVFEQSLGQNINNFLCFSFPNLMRKLGGRFTDKDLSDFFMKVIKDTIDYREENKIYQKDFMHLLIQLKNRGKLVNDNSIFNLEGEEMGSEVITFNELAAQAFVFFIAGFETSSTTMTFCLYELTQNKEIQEKVRAEINEILEKHDGQITYEALQEMHYLDNVINETLRKYPPLPSLNRKCTEDYIIPDTNIVLKKGASLTIPVYGLHYDEEHFPNPQKFDPDRFNKENKNSRHPYTFLPFGEGPRACIGIRFGLLQTKVGLSVLLKHYDINLNKKTTTPLVMDPRSFIMSTKGGIWLDIKEINQ